MGFWDFLLGGFRKPADDEIYEAPEERKTYGNLFSGGAGRANRDLNKEINESETREESRQIPDREINKMDDRLHQVEKRAREMRLMESDTIKRGFHKMERGLDRMRAAESPLQSARAREKTRMSIKKGYDKIVAEQEGRIAKLESEGKKDRAYRERQRLERTRREMARFYRDAGGRGTLR